MVCELVDTEAIQELYAGASADMVASLLKDEAAFEIPTGSTVSFKLVNWLRTADLIGPKTSSESDPDADWLSAKVAIRWTAVEMTGLLDQDAWLFVNITEPGGDVQQPHGPTRVRIWND